MKVDVVVVVLPKGWQGVDHGKADYHTHVSHAHNVQQVVEHWTILPINQNVYCANIQILCVSLLLYFRNYAFHARNNSSNILPSFVLWQWLRRRWWRLQRRRRWGLGGVQLTSRHHKLASPGGGLSSFYYPNLRPEIHATLTTTFKRCWGYTSAQRTICPLHQGKSLKQKYTLFTI